MLRGASGEDHDARGDDGSGRAGEGESKGPRATTTICLASARRCPDLERRGRLLAVEIGEQLG
ncbi:MAG TPA: hypothetical protein VJQ84_03025, partial [Solirubrobacterales bacterium]|nr:hypothetical protein [Solirubrobacterales bacterium]